MNFQPNDKLVCVDDSPVPASHSTSGMIAKGTVYCVTEVDGPYSEHDPGGVRIVGPLCFNHHGDESWWRANRFRRLEDVQNQNRVTTAEPCTV